MARGIANCTCKTCGATFEKIEFRQNRSAADSWAAWAETYYDECTPCYRERIQAERDEENRKAAEMAAEANLPALSGSEKQVAWANTIRQRVLDDLDKAAENCIEHMTYNKEAGHTWESYTKFLLSTLPEPVRNNYLEKFNFSMDFWKKTGGGFSEEVIAEVEERGYKIRRNGVSNYSKDGKSRIVFEQEIPDDTDDVKSTIDLPSWKRMCYCILKNDHLCRFMGFGPNKEQQARINAIKTKYKAIARGKEV